MINAYSDDKLIYTVLADMCGLIICHLLTSATAISINVDKTCGDREKGLN